MKNKVDKIRSAIQAHFAKLSQTAASYAARAYALGHNDFQKQSECTCELSTSSQNLVELRASEAVYDLGRRVEAEVIRLIVSRAMRDRSAHELYDDLMQLTVRWKQNWARIVLTELAISRQQGFVDAARAIDGEEALVTFSLSENACKWCQSAHVDESGNARVFRLSELPPDNVGLSQKAWRAVASIVHPGCLCAMRRHVPSMTKSLNAEFAPNMTIENRNVQSGSTGPAALFGSPAPANTSYEPSSYAQDIIRDEIPTRYIVDPDIWDYRGNTSEPVHSVTEIHEANEALRDYDNKAKEHMQFLAYWTAERAAAQRALTPESVD